MKRPRQRKLRKRAVLFVVGLLLTGFAIGLLSRRYYRNADEQQALAPIKPAITLESILRGSSPILGNTDILGLNLACAFNLLGSDKLELHVAQATLDSWAKQVKAETERYISKFHRNPADFNNSEAYFRICLAVTS